MFALVRPNTKIFDELVSFKIICSSPHGDNGDLPFQPAQSTDGRDILEYLAALVRLAKDC